MTLSKIFAETAGTFAMIFVGGGSIALSEKYPHIFPALGVPLAWGIIIALMIVAMGSVSGAHFNPAVTLAFAAAKRLPVNHVPVYWGSQFAGGLIAISLLQFLKK